MLAASEAERSNLFWNNFSAKQINGSGAEKAPDLCFTLRSPFASLPYLSLLCFIGNHFLHGSHIAIIPSVSSSRESTPCCGTAQICKNKTLILTCGINIDICPCRWQQFNSMNNFLSTKTDRWDLNRKHTSRYEAGATQALDRDKCDSQVEFELRER